MILRWLIAAACWALGACAPGPGTELPLPQPAQAQALIGATGARFVFPLGTRGIARAGAAERPLGWTVYWWGPGMGVNPHAIWVKQRAASADSLGPFEAMVMTSINDSEPPQSSGVVDAEVLARTREGRLVVEVRGRAAVKRTFPIVPDSVRLSWPVNSEGTRGAMIAVELREPWH